MSGAWVNLKDWVELDMLRVWFPGIEPLENSHVRNMALFKKGNSRNGDPKSLGKEWETEALADLEMQLRAGVIPGE